MAVLYIYLNGRPIAVLNGSTLYYLHDDRLGAPQLATDENQAVQWQASYDAFGQASFSGTVTQNLRLPGQYFDVESGWNHNGFRDYAPALGRYAEPDPLAMQGTARLYDVNSGRFLGREPASFFISTPQYYLYAADNPTDLIDPMGLCADPPAKRDCMDEAKDAAAEAVKSNFNLDFVGVSVTTGGGLLLSGETLGTAVNATGEGLLYTGIWTAGSAAVQFNMTGFVCSISQIQAGLNYIASLGSHH